MEAKLIKDRLFLRKVVDSYVLHRIKDGILTIEGDSQYTIGGIEPFYKLSLSNCQAIENGYDLDELVSERLSTRFDENSGYHKFVFVEAYKEGFQKALEILGDRKFSEEDIKNAMERVWYWHEDNQDKDCPTLYELIPKHIQSLQQAEWDVEIVTTTIMENGKCGLDVPIVKPKLDTDGCLILKRI